MFKKTPLFLLLFFLIGLQFCKSQTVVQAVGDQIYCPMTQIPVATLFNIEDSGGEAISEVFIQISTGYVIDEDKLLLSGSHPNITTTWDNIQGKLTLSAIGGNILQDLIDAVQGVVFESNSPTVSGSRTFSFSIGDANYLPATGHYYEFVPSLGITWKDARTAASNRTYYGLQGYLATIGSAEESQLAGEQASGAGWIGGSDEEVEGIWKWVTGPEAGTVFWNGGPNGSAPSGQYANWNTGEPNNAGDEDYAHITAPGVGKLGSWNDLSNTGSLINGDDYQPQGYIVEYGGMPGDPDIDISAYTTLTVEAIENITEASRCGTGSVSLSATTTSGDPVLWYDALTGGNLVYKGNDFITPSLSEATTYYAMSSRCTNGERTAITATIHQLPTITPNITYINCDADGVADGFTDFNLNEIDALLNPNNTSNLTITYHLTMANAEDGIDQLDLSPFNNETASTIFARVENAIGCHALATINLKVTSTSFLENYLQTLEYCDDDGTNDGIYSFNLDSTIPGILAQSPTEQNLQVYFYESLSDAHLNQNRIQNTTNYSNMTPFSQSIYVRVQSGDNGDCFGVGAHLQLIVNPLPEFEVGQSEILCLNGSPIVLGTYNANANYSYTWTNELGEVVSTESTATVTSNGTYTVIATSVDGCESLPVRYAVETSEIAKLTDASVTIDDLSGENTITINTNALGIGDYEFSLGDMDGPYQDDPVFNDVAPGVYTLYARDKNGCDISALEIYVMGFPKYFTPNNDGYNDFWNLKGFEGQFTQQSYIDIFDRYGSFLARILLYDQTGWDGQYKGVPLPATDYWYVAHFFEHTGQVRNFKGHFSLIR